MNTTNLTLAITSCALFFSSSMALSQGEDITKLIDAGNDAYKKKDFANAEQNFSNALTQLQSLSTDARLSSCLNGLGLAYEAEGKKDLALDAYKKALAAREATAGASDISLEPIINNLAQLEKSTGDV